MSFIFSCFYPCIFSGDFDFFCCVLCEKACFFLSSTTVALLQVLGLTTLEYIVAA